MKTSVSIDQYIVMASRVILCGFILGFSACVEPVDSEADPAGSSATTPAPTSQTAILNQHDVALRFLTAFVRLDRNMALQYATPEAVASLDWGRSHGVNVPYYDDKMILHYTGGWARVYFQEVNGGYQIAKIEAHSR